MGKQAGAAAEQQRPVDASESDRGGAFLHVSVPLLAVDQRATASGDGAPSLLDLARAHAFDPTSFDDHPPYFVRQNISNDLLDAYGTRMHETSLRNYAADAEAGVAVLQSHNTRELPIGRSIAGKYVGPGGDGLQRVESTAYIAQGLRLGSVDADQVVAGIRTGVIHDVSIGFYGGSMACSICGRSYWDWDCTHVPGVEYPVIDSKGNETGREVAFVWIRDAHLAEYSYVYDGATPKAEVIEAKAQQEAEAGRLRPETARLLVARYRIHLPASATRRAWAKPPQEETVSIKNGRRHDPGDDASEDTEATPVDQTDEAAQDDEDGEADDESAEGTAEQTATEGEDRVTPAQVRAVLTAAGAPAGAGLRWLAEEITRLRPLADVGRAYRADLIAETLAEGVRAFGAAWPMEAKRAILERPTTTLDEIKAERDFNAAEATKRFPGGRVTTEPAAEQPPKTAPATPDRAYAA